MFSQRCFSRNETPKNKSMNSFVFESRRRRRRSLESIHPYFQQVELIDRYGRLFSSVSRPRRRDLRGRCYARELIAQSIAQWTFDRRRSSSNGRRNNEIRSKDRNVKLSHNDQRQQESTSLKRAEMVDRRQKWSLPDCEVTLVYRCSLVTHCGPMIGDDILITQEKSINGDYSIVFKGFLNPGDSFTFKSLRREKECRFTLCVYINNIIDNRTSSCCENKYRDETLRLDKDKRIFSVQHIEHAFPCRKCQSDQGTSRERRLFTKTDSFSSIQRHESSSTPSLSDTIPPANSKKQNEDSTTKGSLESVHSEKQPNEQLPKRTKKKNPRPLKEKTLDSTDKKSGTQNVVTPQVEMADTKESDVATPSSSSRIKAKNTGQSTCSLLTQHVKSAETIEVPKDLVAESPLSSLDVPSTAPIDLLLKQMTAENEIAKQQVVESAPNDIFPSSIIPSNRQLMADSSPSSEGFRPEGNVENFVVVWLDGEIGKSGDSRNTLVELRQVVNFLQTFTDIGQCVQFVNRVSAEKIFLLVSGRFGEEIISEIEHLIQLHSIYVFCGNKKKHKDSWVKEHPEKVRGVFDDIKIICQQLKEDVAQCSNDLVTISSVSAADIDANDEDRNQQDPMFVYSQLLKEILLESTENEVNAREEMISFCKEQYKLNDKELSLVKEFEGEFGAENAIWWYTQECFIFKMLNRALRTPEPDILYKLRLFIKSLHKQVVSESESQGAPSSTITVYRGQRMTIEDFEKLSKNNGGLLSFNSFLSTSLEAKVALGFAGKPQKGIASVIFHMKIDPHVSNSPFANVEELSFFKKEREILFSMGTVFRITGIDKLNNGMYRMHLQLSGDQDQRLQKYMLHMRSQIVGEHALLRLMRLMLEMGQYNKAEQFAQMIASDQSLKTNTRVLAAISHLLGTTFHAKGDYDRALEQLQKSLAIYLRSKSADHPSLSPTYNNIGSIYLAQGKIEEALVYQKKALEIQINSSSPTLESIITYSNNIGSIYEKAKDYENALIYYERALRTQQRFLPPNDPALVRTYNNLGDIYRAQGNLEQSKIEYAKAVEIEQQTPQTDTEADAGSILKLGARLLKQSNFSEALVQLKKGLQIQLKYMLPTNPTLATTYHMIATAYDEEKVFDEALIYFRKTLDIELNGLAPDNPTIAVTYHNIARVLTELDRLDEAVLNAKLAVDQLLKRPQPDFKQLSASCVNLASLYHKQKKYNEARVYFQRAIEFRLQGGPANDPGLAPLYNNIGSAFYREGNYVEAIEFYKRTLDIELLTLSDHPTIGGTYHNMATAYEGLRQYDQAIQCADKAVAQLLKTKSADDEEVQNNQTYAKRLRQKHILSEIFSNET